MPLLVPRILSSVRLTGNAMTETTLSKKTCKEIDSWLKKYPADQKQSAVLAALREVQHENKGYLTTELKHGVNEFIREHRSESVVIPAVNSEEFCWRSNNISYGLKCGCRLYPVLACG